MGEHRGCAEVDEGKAARNVSVSVAGGNPATSLNVCTRVTPPHYWGLQCEIQLLKTLPDSSSSPHFYSCCCLSLLFSLLFVSSPENSSFILTLFSQFSLSPSLSLSRRSHLTFPVLLSSNSLNIFGAVGTYFSITVPLITSVVLFLSTGMWTPSPLPT